MRWIDRERGRTGRYLLLTWPLIIIFFLSWLLLWLSKQGKTETECVCVCVCVCVCRVRETERKRYDLTDKYILGFREILT